MSLRPTLRLKLMLVSLSLFMLPWMGWRYVQEMERFLLDAQRQALLATAQAVATVLHERPDLLRVLPDAEAAAQPLDAARRAAAAERAERSGQPVVVEEIGRESGVGRQVSVGEITAILRGLERASARIWVVNRELRLLALAGSLRPGPKADAGQGEPAPPVWRELLARLVPQPAEDFDEALDPDVLANGRDLRHALLGAPATRVRKSSDGRAVIVSAAYPIWSHDEVIGAVVAEATTHPILAVRSQALERLLWLSLTAFAVVVLGLLGFATRLSSRIRRLRDEAESAVDAQGRLTRLRFGSRAGDEIGDLSRSFSSVLEKLAQHHGYLESLAGRLSHELRTPIAVVRTSLENLRLEDDPAQRGVYLERAEEGIARLAKILSRMGEASRLEQSLRSETRARFDLAPLVADCVTGYRQIHPQQAFELVLPATENLWLEGSPDLMAQLLDKLVANAVDFARPGTTITLELSRPPGALCLEVSNLGPPIAEAVRGRLFESMSSARPAGGDRREPHLGLGLYIARLIAEFHGGRIEALERPDGDGVRMRLTFPLAAA